VTPADPYGALIDRVLAGELQPEAAALEAVDLMEKLKGAGTGFSISFSGLNEENADLLQRFIRAAEDEMIRRIGLI
jgi:hypothetical protein